jgi:hypothetical protein
MGLAAAHFEVTDFARTQSAHAIPARGTAKNNRIRRVAERLSEQDQDDGGTIASI